MALADESALAHFNLGLAFRQKGYYAEALREYELALDRGEERALVQQAIAEVHLLRRDVAGAVAAYDLLLAEHPTSPKLWNERGVALHQDGRYAEAAHSYRRAIDSDGRYAIAHNNLGVALYHAGDTASAAESFGIALQLVPAFVQARLNAALLHFKAKRLSGSLEAYRRVLADEPEHAGAWNGVGLVLTELRRFEEARNAFARAVQNRPNYAEARYNLSFALSNLGEFDAALRETKRALELDPYYVPQKFELAIDFQYEHPELSIVPDLAGAARTEDTTVADFAFDASLLDSLFMSLTPATGVEAVQSLGPDPFGIAVDYLSQGSVRSSGRRSRAVHSSAVRTARAGMTILGDLFLRQGLHGEALERYRDARRTNRGCGGRNYWGDPRTRRPGSRIGGAGGVR